MRKIAKGLLLLCCGLFSMICPPGTPFCHSAFHEVCFAGNALAAGTGQVFDEAGLLTREEADALRQKAQELSGDTHYDFLLATTDDAEGKEAREYAEDFYMEHKTTIDGVIYLIDMDNREIYVATSGDMRYCLDDERVDTILDDGYNWVSQEKYGKCFSAMLEDTAEFLEEGIQDGTYTVDEDTGKITYYEKPKSISRWEFLVALAAGLASAGGFFCAVMGKYKMKWGSYSYSYQDNSSLTLDRQQDVLVNRMVTHRHIPKDPPPSSGGGGGHASTVHTGSGGNSFGGGGRKF